MQDRVAHPAAELFPLLDGPEFDALVTDIQTHGLREPITLHDGAILDGRNRYRACQVGRVEPHFEEWDGDGDPVAFVVSKNLHRRHLSDTQRAMISGRLATLRLGDVQSQRDGVNKYLPSLSAEQAGALLNVGRASVQNAKKVLAEGTPEEIAAVERGEVGVKTVADQIRKRIDPEERKRRRDAGMSQTGKNPERIQRQQINAEIWGRVRDAVTHLTSLPLPADVVAIVRAHDKTGLIDQRLSRAMDWLKEFDNEWSDRGEDAA